MARTGPAGATNAAAAGAARSAVVAFAGRRPSTAPDAEMRPDIEAVLTVRIRRLLGALTPRVVVGSAAAGVDLLVLEAAVARAVRAVVVVAPSVAMFRSTSVADAGGGWGARYDAIVASELVEVVATTASEPGWKRHLAVTHAVLDRAEQEAEKGPDAADLVALAVFDEARRRADATAAFAAESRRRGIGVLALSPLDGAVRYATESADLRGRMGLRARDDVPADLLPRIGGYRPGPVTGPARPSPS